MSHKRIRGRAYLYVILAITLACIFCGSFASCVTRLESNPVVNVGLLIGHMWIMGMVALGCGLSLKRASYLFGLSEREGERLEESVVEKERKRWQDPSLADVSFLEKKFRKEVREGGAWK